VNRSKWDKGFAGKILADAFGLPAAAPFVLFAVARSVGWIAHSLEQLSTGTLIRPRARYTGPELGAPFPLLRGKVSLQSNDG
jgi:citrate synthase